MSRAFNISQEIGRVVKRSKERVKKIHRRMLSRNQCCKLKKERAVNVEGEGVINQFSYNGDVQCTLAV